MAEQIKTIIQTLNANQVMADQMAFGLVSFCASIGYAYLFDSSRVENWMLLMECLLWMLLSEY